MKLQTSLWERVRHLLHDSEVTELTQLLAELEQPQVPRNQRLALQAQLTYAGGDAQGARRLLEEAAESRALSPEEQLVLGHLLLDAGQVERVRALFLGAQAAGLEDPRIQSGLGIVALHEGDIVQALLSFEASLEQDPAAWHVRYLLGLAYSMSHKPIRARKLFEKVIGQRPDFEPGWLGFAAMSIECGEYSESILVFEKALKLFPDSQGIALAFADLIRRAGSPHQALAVLAPIASRSRDPSFVLDFAEMSLQAGRADIAGAALDVVDTLEPTSARSRVLRGHILETSKPRQLEAAVRCYREALNFDPNNVRAKAALGLLLLRESPVKNWSESGALLSSLCEGQDAPVAPLTNLAILRVSEGRNDEARALATRVLERKDAPEGVRKQAQRVLAAVH